MTDVQWSFLRPQWRRPLPLAAQFAIGKEMGKCLSFLQQHWEKSLGRIYYLKYSLFEEWYL